MYIAMNRFRIVLGKEDVFENIWKGRDTHLKDVSGFINFNLVKGQADDESTLYASHSTWESQDAFIAWTKSEAFKLAHKNAGQHKDIYIGHPVFEGFNIIL